MPRALAAVLLLGLAAPPAAARADEAKRPPPPVLRTVTGKLTQVARAERRLVIATAGESVTLTWDRNTAVYLEERLGSLGDLAVGQPVRASFGDEARAYWVEIRSAEAVLPPTAPAEQRGEAKDAVLPPPGG